jgi:hypothetical protein
VTSSSERHGPHVQRNFQIEEEQTPQARSENPEFVAGYLGKERGASEGPQTTCEVLAQYYYEGNRTQKI